MTHVDYILAGIVLVSVLIGVIRGFLRESIALLGWLVGLWMAWRYASVVQPYLGGLLRDNSGDKDPPLLLVPTDIAPGKKWISAFQNSVAGYSIRGAVDFKTVAFEDVTIQGETMKAYRVTMEGLLGRLLLTGTVWIEPKSMRMVRWDRVLTAGPTVLESARIEVTDYRAAPRP